MRKKVRSNFFFGDFSEDRQDVQVYAHGRKLPTLTITKRGRDDVFDFLPVTEAHCVPCGQKHRRAVHPLLALLWRVRLAENQTAVRKLFERA